MPPCLVLLALLPLRVVASPVPLLELSQMKPLQVFTESLSNQSRAVHLQTLGGTSAALRSLESTTI